MQRQAAVITPIDQNLENAKTATIEVSKRVSDILHENVFEITQRALTEMKSDRLLKVLPLTDEQRIEFTPRTIEELARMLESTEPEQAARDFVQHAIVRGAKRYQQGYTLSQLAAYVRLVEQAMYDVIHEHLQRLDLDCFMFDLKRLNASLSLQLEHTLAAFLDEERRVGGQQGLYPNCDN